MEESLRKFMNESGKRHKENPNLNSKLIFKPRQTTIPFPSHLYDDCYDEEKGSYGLKDLDAYSIRTAFRNGSLPIKEKDSGSFILTCYINSICFEKALADLGASVSVMPLSTYLNLGIGKFVFPVDFIILDVPEDVNVPLILEILFLSTAHAKVDVLPPTLRSFDLLYGDDIDLNDLNEPQELKRNRVDNLEPTIEEGEVVNEPMIDIVKTRCDFIGGLDDYPIVEDMDPYLDEGMGDVIVGEPFCKASYVEARRFDGIITIRDGDDSVTYQMVWSNPKFKHLTNDKCNKIPPLLKVSEQDKMNGISHSNQKLKGFYKGVLNLRPEFIRDAKVEEWLTYGYISVHEMELRA
ncbi:hypothetical protein Tco_1083289 [Tanacetum coccineum]